MPSQWEYQIGPCLGIDSGDHLWMARYLAARVAEEWNVSISLEPKIFKDWNGSGAHTNYSTKTMREGWKGMAYIHDMMKKFEEKHALHISVYGSGNEKRLTGHHETSSMDKFTYGCGDRAASFRIPTNTMHNKGKGYIEDRRPSSNMDPYVVTSIMFDTSVLPVTMAKEMVAHYKEWAAWLKT